MKSNTLYTVLCKIWSWTQRELEDPSFWPGAQGSQLNIFLVQEQNKKRKRKTFRVEQCKQLSENFPKDAPKIFAFEHYLNLIIVVTNHKDAPAALDIV